MNEAYDGQQFVGIDLHRRRSVLVRMTESGEHLDAVRIMNDPYALAAVMAQAGEHRRWCWKPPTGGIGLRTCCPVWAPRCTWRIRWG